MLIVIGNAFLDSKIRHVMLGNLAYFRSVKRRGKKPEMMMPPPALAPSAPTDRTQQQSI
jgi:hypothetical protein